MGQAKVRGSFAARKEAAVLRNAADDKAQREKLAQERFALNEWRKANPKEAERQRQEDWHMSQVIAIAAGLGAGMLHR